MSIRRAQKREDNRIINLEWEKDKHQAKNDQQKKCGKQKTKVLKRRQGS